MKYNIINKQITFKQWQDLQEEYLMERWDEYKWEKLSEYFHYDNVDYWDEQFFEEMCDEEYYQDFLQRYTVALEDETDKEAIDNTLSAFKTYEEALTYALKNSESNNFRILYFVN